MVTKLDPLLPEAEVDPDSRPALDWPTDPWDNADRTGAVERLRRQSRPLKWVVWALMVVGIAAILISGGVGWWYLQRINPEGEPGAVQGFVIPEGQTFGELSLRLYDTGIITDIGVWEWYVDRNGGLEVTPGFYEVRPDDHMGNVLTRLRTPPAQTYSSVTFPEGFTIAQMSRRLETVSDRMNQADFVVAANDVNVSSLYRPLGESSLEGLLFPDTYQVSNAESEAQVVDRMIGLMERVGSQEEIFSKGQALGRTPYEILIIASMIEKEAKVDEDRAKISRVIHNRLAVTAADPQSPFPLQIDAAVLYGRTQLELDTDMPFRELRQIPSDWNTYLIDGLPRTPIANAGRASIRAALNPAPNPPPGDPICRDLPRPDQCFFFFYVLADEDGRHAFAATAEQHQQNVNEAAANGLLD